MRMLNLARKLRGRSLHELRVRGAQALSAAAERRGWSAQVRVPGDDEFLRQALHDGSAADAQVLLDRFRSGVSTSAFFAAFDDQDRTLALVRSRWPNAEREIVARAERVREGRFDLLGRQDLSFGNPIDWCLDPTTGKQTPLLHWSRIDHLDAEAVGEYKVTWELNRHQHFLTLGQAYWLTADERFAATFVEHLVGWMDANPPTRGINWSSSLEVAFRSISWIWALHFFRDSEQLTPDIFLRALKFLYLQGKHVERYLSTYFSPNTHLTGEALSLFYLAVVFPEFKLAGRWRATGLDILLEQLDIHVRPDGVYFEQSTYYHRYTADFYTHLYVLCDRNGIELPDRVAERLQALLDHLMFVARPDGTTPLIGDDDGGRLISVDRRAPNDFRAALSTGAALFSREDYRFAAQELAEETVFLLGAESVRRFDALRPSPPAEASRAFSEGGYFVMRDGWTADANYLLVDCGPHGVSNCGHAHADALSLELAAGGEAMLIDPGTFTYILPAEERDRFRSSGAHNTVTLDGKSSSVPAGPFSWASIARCSLRSWIARPRFDYFEGSHDGYATLGAPASHVRSILFLKNDYWIIRDQVISDGVHRADLGLQFAPGVDLADAPGGTITASRGKAVLDIKVFGHGSSIGCDEAWVSRSFGERTRARFCRVSVASEAGLRLFTFLLPRSPSDRRRELYEIDADQGHAFAVRQEGSEDLVAIADNGAVEMTGLTTDFAWTWLRRSHDAAPPVELLLLGGRTIHLDGEEVFRSAERVGYVVGKREGQTLHVETDAVGEVAIASLGAREILINGRAIRGSEPVGAANGRPGRTILYTAS